MTHCDKRYNNSLLGVMAEKESGQRSEVRGQGLEKERDQGVDKELR